MSTDLIFPLRRTYKKDSLLFNYQDQINKDNDFIGKIQDIIISQQNNQYRITFRIKKSMTYNDENNLQSHIREEEVVCWLGYERCIDHLITLFTGHACTNIVKQWKLAQNALNSQHVTLKDKIDYFMTIKHTISPTTEYFFRTFNFNANPECKVIYTIASKKFRIHPSELLFEDIRRIYRRVLSNGDEDLNFSIEETKHSKQIIINLPHSLTLAVPGYSINRKLIVYAGRNDLTESMKFFTRFNLTSSNLNANITFDSKYLDNFTTDNSSIVNKRNRLLHISSQTNRNSLKNLKKIGDIINNCVGNKAIEILESCKNTEMDKDTQLSMISYLLAKNTITKKLHMSFRSNIDISNNETVLGFIMSYLKSVREVSRNDKVVISYDMRVTNILDSVAEHIYSDDTLRRYVRINNNTQNTSSVNNVAKEPELISQIYLDADLEGRFSCRG